MVPNSFQRHGTTVVDCCSSLHTTPAGLLPIIGVYNPPGQTNTTLLTCLSMALCTRGSEPTIIAGDFQHQLHQHVGTQHPSAAHRPCCWAGGFHAQQRLCLVPAVCISFRRRVAGPHVGQSAPHLAAREANPFCQRCLVLRPPRCWLNINLADYYEYMQHLISQFWLNGQVKFSLTCSTRRSWPTS